MRFDELHAQFDAVLVACGAMDRGEVQAWGLTVGPRGIEVHAGTYETNLPGVFAAGNAIRSKGLVVRSVADGKEAAAAIASTWPAGRSRRPIVRSRRGWARLHAEELPELLARAADLPRRGSTSIMRWTPFLRMRQRTRPIAAWPAVAAAHGNCRLERYAAQYGADPAGITTADGPLSWSIGAAH